MVGKKPLLVNRSTDQSDRGSFRFLKSRAGREVWQRFAKRLGYKAEKGEYDKGDAVARVHNF